MQARVGEAYVAGLTAEGVSSRSLIALELVTPGLAVLDLHPAALTRQITAAASFCDNGI
jgi:hypothetical protein